MIHCALSFARWPKSLSGKPNDLRGCATDPQPAEHWVIREGLEPDVDAVKCDGRHGSWRYQIARDVAPKALG